MIWHEVRSYNTSLVTYTLVSLRSPASSSLTWLAPNVSRPPRPETGGTWELENSPAGRGYPHWWKPPKIDLDIYRHLKIWCNLMETCMKKIEKTIKKLGAKNFAGLRHATGSHCQHAGDPRSSLGQYADTKARSEMTKVWVPFWVAKASKMAAFLVWKQSFPWPTYVGILNLVHVVYCISYYDQCLHLTFLLFPSLTLKVKVYTEYRLPNSQLPERSADSAGLAGIWKVNGMPGGSIQGSLVPTAPQL